MAASGSLGLLDEDEEAELRWKDLDDAGLNAEIDALRHNIRNTSERLLNLGITPDWEADQSQSTARRDGTAGDGGQDLEEEDVRYAVSTHCCSR